MNGHSRVPCSFSLSLLICYRGGGGDDDDDG